MIFLFRCHHRRHCNLLLLLAETMDTIELQMNAPQEEQTIRLSRKCLKSFMFLMGACIVDY